jgi:hypothetical protein
MLNDSDCNNYTSINEMCESERQAAPLHRLGESLKKFPPALFSHDVQLWSCLQCKWRPTKASRHLEQWRLNEDYGAKKKRQWGGGVSKKCLIMASLVHIPLQRECVLRGVFDSSLQCHMIICI